MAVFGVPQVHEDDPVRAIRTAMEIHAAVKAISPKLQDKVGHPLWMHTGINTGLVVTDDILPFIATLMGMKLKVKKQILVRAGKNPFFIEEVVRSLIDEGAVVKSDGGFEVTAKIDRVVIPPTINDVLMAGIDRLEGRTRELVKVASVIGRSFFDLIIKDVADAIDNIDERLQDQDLQDDRRILLAYRKARHGDQVVEQGHQRRHPPRRPPGSSAHLF